MNPKRKKLPKLLREEIRRRYARDDLTMRALAHLYYVSPNLIWKTIHRKGEAEDATEGSLKE